MLVVGIMFYILGIKIVSGGSFSGNNLGTFEEKQKR